VSRRLADVVISGGDIGIAAGIGVEGHVGPTYTTGVSVNVLTGPRPTVHYSGPRPSGPISRGRAMGVGDDRCARSDDRVIEATHLAVGLRECFEQHIAVGRAPDCHRQQLDCVVLPAHHAQSLRLANDLPIMLATALPGLWGPRNGARRSDHPRRPATREITAFPVCACRRASRRTDRLRPRISPRSGLCRTRVACSA
jgi:hypothetical protein